jgi:hypothetical protein
MSRHKHIIPALIPKRKTKKVTGFTGDEEEVESVTDDPLMDSALGESDRLLKDVRRFAPDAQMDATAPELEDALANSVSHELEPGSDIKALLDPENRRGEKWTPPEGKSYKSSKNPRCR